MKRKRKRNRKKKIRNVEEVPVAAQQESKEDVGKALQLHVARMKPSLLELPAVAVRAEACGS